jgi:hypothetical protein
MRRCHEIGAPKWHVHDVALLLVELVPLSFPAGPLVLFVCSNPYPKLILVIVESVPIDNNRAHRYDDAMVLHPFCPKTVSSLSTNILIITIAHIDERMIHPVAPDPPPLSFSGFRSVAWRSFWFVGNGVRLP